MKQLSQEEQASLCVRARAGNMSARNQMVVANMGLVYQRAHKWVRVARSLELEDLVSEGAIGLVDAIRKFDPTKAKFSTYAVPWIDHHIRLAIGKDKEQRRSDSNRASVAHEVFDLVRAGETKEKAIETTAAKHKMKVSTVEGLCSAVGKSSPVSLNKPIGEDGSAEFGDTIADSSVAVDEQLSEERERARVRRSIERFRRRLSEREQSVLDDRVLADPEDALTLSEVGVRWSVSRERIRQIELVLRRKLRMCIRESRRWASRDKEDRAYLAGLCKQFRADRIAIGQCVCCAKKSATGKTYCQKHLDERRVWALERRRANGVKPHKFRFITHRGETLPLARWAKRMGLGQELVHWRLKKGWGVSRALETPPAVGLAKKGICKRGHKVAEVGTTRLSSGYLLCKACQREVYRAKQDESRRRRYAARRAAGLCGCGRQPIPGRGMCQRCTDRLHRVKSGREGKPNDDREYGATG